MNFYPPIGEMIPNFMTAHMFLKWDRNKTHQLVWRWKPWGDAKPQLVFFQGLHKSDHHVVSYLEMKEKKITTEAMGLFHEKKSSVELLCLYVPPVTEVSVMQP